MLFIMQAFFNTTGNISVFQHFETFPVMFENASRMKNKIYTCIHKYIQLCVCLCVSEIEIETITVAKSKFSILVVQYFSFIFRINRKERIIYISFIKTKINCRERKNKSNCL